jgi:hypothetical protein
MTDPLRLLDGDGDISALERRVLDRATSISPPPGAKAQVWSLVSAKVGVAATAAAAKSTSLVLTAKAIAAGALVGVAATAGAAFLFAPTQPPPAAQQAAPLERPSANSTTASGQPGAQASAIPAPEPAPPRFDETKRPALEAMPPRADLRDVTAPSIAGTPEPRSSRGAFPDDPHEAPRELPSLAMSSNVDRARFESQRVAEARGLLRAGRAEAALSVLNGLAKEVPSGVLVQEREALTVQALLASGARERARTLARDFLSRYPNSPHGADVSRALE